LGVLFSWKPMLKQRILTALVLLALLLPALWASAAWPFMALTVLLIAAGAWEWGRLNGLRPLFAWTGAALCLLACGVALQLGWVLGTPPWLWLSVGALWVLLGAWILHRGVSGWALWPRWARWLGGLLLLALAWLALAQAHQRGVNFLLSVLVLVWAADVFAYFSGKAMGRRWIKTRLASRISPGKSWEGVLGGMMGVLVVAFAWAEVDRRWDLPNLSFFSLLLAKGGWLALPALLFMAAMSVVGDLVESLVKRSAGMKDSSALLPGHGGVLDRLDALLPALPLAMMLVFWI